MLAAGRTAGWAFVSLDGTLIPISRSSARSAAGHDITSAREHVLPALYPAAANGLPTLTDKGYTGAGIGIHVPLKGRGLAIDNQARNLLISALRTPSDRANARFKSTFKALRRVTPVPLENRPHRRRHVRRPDHAPRPRRRPAVRHPQHPAPRGRAPVREAAARIETAFAADERHDEVDIAWQAIHQFRAAYAAKDLRAGKKTAIKVLDTFPPARSQRSPGSGGPCASGVRRSSPTSTPAAPATAAPRPSLSGALREASST